MFPLRAIIALVRAFPRLPLGSVSELANMRRQVDYMVIPEDWYEVGSEPELVIYWRAK